jgi:hypothetical protein
MHMYINLLLFLFLQLWCLFYFSGSTRGKSIVFFIHFFLFLYTGIVFNHIVHSPMEVKGSSKYLSLVFHRSLEHAIWTFCELGIANLIAYYQAAITTSELSRLYGNNWNAEFLYRL